MIYVAIPFLFVGVVMWTRGLIYTLRPDGKYAEKRKRKNLKVGFTTDMKVFGPKVRRLGFMITLVGVGIVAWDFSGRSSSTPDAPAASPSDAPPTADAQG